MRRLTELSSATSAVRCSPGARRASDDSDVAVGVGGHRHDRRLGLDERQLEVEATALAGRALDLQLAAHAADEPVADRQAEARAAELGARSRLTKRLKDRAQVLGFDPDAGVDHVEAQPPRARPRPNLQLDLALRRELDGVAEQVEEDLAHVPAVEDDARRRCSRRCAVANASPLRCARSSMT